jgi:deoxyribodipyrimidine photo-lyase
MTDAPAIVWFRRDLRITDNPALEAAMKNGSSVIPVFIWAPEEEAPWSPGSASRWWLHQSLKELGQSLREHGSKLIIRRGPTKETLLNLASESRARAVYWNRLYEPATVVQGSELKKSLRERGLVAESFQGNLLFEPGTILNDSQKPFRVFTAFWRACLEAPQPATAAGVPRRLTSPGKWPSSLAVADLDLLSRVDWAEGIREAWRPGESGAASLLKSFLRDPMRSYSEERDRPDHTGTSRLSPHLHFGEVSARQIWHTAHKSSRPRAEPFLRQLVWREFAHHLLFHHPEAAQEPLHAEFRFFPWRVEARALKAWTRGLTGYPLVDAGMRELWRTGWMHNRVRMVVASLLVKDLLQPWREGAAWFWDTLVDADLANNTLGWQWVAGCGADAAPYFRIFNPELQGQKFDPEGDYVRRWVPELARLPAKWIHKPWKAPEPVLRNAGVIPGTTYPRPIVIHEAARKRALAALETMRREAVRRA